jgi:uncharacterized membrane protein
VPVTDHDCSPPGVDPAASRVARALGFPPAALAAPTAVGAFNSSIILDLGAKLNSAPCSGYTYPSFLLLTIGLVAGIVTVSVALPDLAGLPRPGEAFRSGVQQLLLWDASLVMFGISAYLRFDKDTCADVAWPPLLASAAGVVFLAVATVKGLRSLFASRLEPASKD